MVFAATLAMLVPMMIMLMISCAIAATSSGIADLDPERFHAQVVQDSRVWMVEFYSPMCGSCQEFTPTWKKIAQKAKSVAKGQINIDDPKGMALADKLGALQEGIPNVRLFTKVGDEKGVSVVNGETPTGLEAVTRSVKAALHGVEKSSQGFLTKLT